MSTQAEAARVLTPQFIAIPQASDEICAHPAHLPEQHPPASGTETFSALTTRGGVYLGLRYGLGVLISIGNMLVLTWWIGPHAYGIFVTAAGLTAFLGSLTRSGVDTYLVRRAAPPDDSMFEVASTLIAALSIVLTAFGVGIIPLLSRWYGNREFVPAYAVLLLTIPLVGLVGPPTAKLERALNFRAVAQIELGSQFLALMVSCTLAWRGMGVWAPVFGHLTWQFAAAVAAFWTARFAPRVRFNAACAREMLSFGLGYTASLRTWQLRTLVNPLLVGRFAGSEGVAFVGLAIRIAESLGFIRIAAARLAIAALARLQQNKDKFRDALQKALAVQVLVLGPLLCGFALLGPLLVQKLIGARWTPSLQVFPFIAAGVLVNSVFNLQASALFVLGEQWVVLKSYATHVALLVVGTFLLIPRFGLAGYGWADLIACAAYIFLQSGLSRIIGISHTRLLLWVVAFRAPLFVHKVNHGWGLLLSLPLLAIVTVASSPWSQYKLYGHKSCLQGALAAHMKHVRTFLLKMRYRGPRYAFAVLQYVLASRSYRLRLSATRLLRGTENQRPSPPRKQNRTPDHIDATDNGFHFSAADIPQIVSAIPDTLKQKSIVEARRVLDQHFCFRGEERSFPDEIDWHVSAGGNTSWNWDLNRHRFFLSLGTAYYYTGETRYLSKLIELWDHWTDKNPLGHPRSWNQPFEVAARLHNWIWAFFFLKFSRHCDSEHLARFLSGIRDHAGFLYSNLEYHWPNNHLLLEAKALLEYSILFSQFPENRKFLARAQRILKAQVAAQILSDGVHSELGSMYHQIVAGELAELQALCQAIGRALPPELEHRVAASLEFTRALLREDGSAPLLGDSAQEDCCLRFAPWQQDYSDLNYWVWHDRGSCRHVPQQSAKPPQLSVFPQGGYAFLREEHAGQELYVSFDFGQFSRCESANHAHCDALSFELYAGGQPVIIDPGVYLPWNDDSGWARYFRSTAAHNAVMVDSKEQSELCDFANVRRNAQTRLIHHYIARGSAGVSAECMPYWATQTGIRHRRKIRYEAIGTITICDDVAGSGRHRLDWNFQFAPQIDVVAEKNGNLVLRSRASAGCFRFECVSEVRPSVTLARGQTEPRRGWISRNSAQLLPSYAALYSVEVELPFVIAFRFAVVPSPPV